MFWIVESDHVIHDKDWTIVQANCIQQFKHTRLPSTSDLHLRFNSLNYKGILAIVNKKIKLPANRYNLT